MNKNNFYYAQLVQESDLDDIYSDVDEALQNVLTDQAYYGVYSGLAVTEHDPVADLTVDVAQGVAYDQEGRRCYVPSSQTVDISEDSQGASTAVVNVGNSKWISLFVQYDTILSDQQTDGDGNNVYARESESYQFLVVQGAEAAAPTRPALQADAILIADILLEHGDTQVFDADIESADTASKPNSRFQFAFNLTSSTPAQVRTGGIPDALQACLDELNDHIGEVANSHSAGAITFDFTSQWAGPEDVTQTSETVADALDGIVADLASATAQGDCGAYYIGYFRDSGPDFTAGAYRVEDALDTLDSRKGSRYANNTWFEDNTFEGALVHYVSDNHSFAECQPDMTNGSGSITVNAASSLDFVEVLSGTDASNQVGQIRVSVTIWDPAIADSFQTQEWIVGYDKASGSSTPSIDVETTSATVQGASPVGLSLDVIADTDSIAIRATNAGGAAQDARYMFEAHRMSANRS